MSPCFPVFVLDVTLSLCLFCWCMSLWYSDYFFFCVFGVTLSLSGVCMYVSLGVLLIVSLTDPVSDISLLPLGLSPYFWPWLLFCVSCTALWVVSSSLSVRSVWCLQVYHSVSLSISPISVLLSLCRLWYLSAYLLCYERYEATYRSVGSVIDIT